VRTGVIRDVHLSLVQENRELKPADLDVLALPFHKFIQIA
jgi:hypothetical protein